jgi:hypothetical protein
MRLRWMRGSFGKTDAFFEGRHREIIDPPIGLQSRLGIHGYKAASSAAPRDILFLSPKNQICAFHRQVF